jgi:hypothetical protein
MRVHLTLRLVAAILAMIAVCTPSRAQQIECTIKVNYESVGAANKDLLINFEEDVRSYMNNYQWGPEQLDEKIRLSLDIFIQSATGENKYMAQVAIGSQRPILDANRNTAVVRLFDEAWEFTYFKERPINHAPHSFSDLASFLDFYACVALGYDYDTYDPMGGTPWFQKASDIASLGRTSSQKGWQQATSGYSRAQLVTDLLNPTVGPIREASYQYHFAGLDSLSANRQRGLANIVRAIERIGIARKTLDPRNLAFKGFFDAKYLEIAEVLREYPDRAVYLTLGRVDPSHQSTYEEFRTK